MSRAFLAAVMISALGSTLIAQTTIYVDASNPNCPGSGTRTDPFCSIQSAVFSGTSGDTVLVEPGVYSENVDFLGKDIRLIGRLGPGATVIDGAGGNAIGLTNGETQRALIRGFEIRNSNTGVCANGAAVTVTGNVFSSNTTAVRAGLSIGLDLGATIITNNTIAGCQGAISCGFASSVLVSNNLLIGNFKGSPNYRVGAGSASGRSRRGFRLP